VELSATTVANNGITIPPTEMTATAVAGSLLFLLIVPEVGTFALQIERAVSKKVLLWSWNAIAKMAKKKKASDSKTMLLING